MTRQQCGFDMSAWARRSNADCAGFDDNSGSNAADLGFLGPHWAA
jgi:hypothetical protein